MNVEKIIGKMKRQPNGVRMDEAEKVLEAFGYVFKRQKGSHRHFMNCAGDVITVIEETPVKAVYVKDILRRIEKKEKE